MPKERKIERRYCDSLCFVVGLGTGRTALSFSAETWFALVIRTTIFSLSHTVYYFRLLFLVPKEPPCKDHKSNFSYFATYVLTVPNLNVLQDLSAM